MNNKNRILIVLVIVILIVFMVGGYIYWKNKQSGAGDKANNTSEKITDSATKGVLPSVSANPLENKPDVNPADKANPFTNIKTNPFE